MYKILMEVHYHMKSGMRDAFLKEVAPYAEMSRAEEGNVMYDYFLNPKDENDLLLLEKWRDDEILAAHFAADHFAKIGQLKEKYVDEVSIAKHYVEVE